MRRITFLSVLTALSSTFYVLENLLPFPVPFGRWGFSNSVVLMIASEIGFGDALIVASAKSILGALFSGRFLSPSFLTGFFGAVSASLVESFLARFDFGYLSLSAMGSFVNNLVQLIVISFLVGSTKTFLLFPLMVILGLVSGTVNAFLASRMGGIVFENYSRFFFAQKKATDGVAGDRVRS